tara:strand:- start:324 stop:731 length:408 start_codon:yes stop_codon:yes gene_type:complete
MATSIKSVGLNSAGAYQISGAPWLTGSDVEQSVATVDGVRVSFPTVTKSVTVINKDSAVDLVVHFASRVNPNVMTNRRYITLKGEDTSMTFAVKCRDIWISSKTSGTATGSFELIAELTPILSEYDLSGSTGTGG